jgi:hypothetical protein
MKLLVILTTASIVAAGAVQAQSPAYPANPATTNQAQYSGGQYGSGGGCGHTPTIKDEYGNRYDAEGNRLNAQGCVIPSPVTPPGSAVR